MQTVTERFFWVLTLMTRGGHHISSKGVIDLRPGSSRDAAYEQIRAYVLARHGEQHAAPVFFTLDRDAL